jgi:ubiquinone biosynthesis protein
LRAEIERALGKPVAELYATFEMTPLASASIAQVHAATLHDGREVVVKVLRPGIRVQIEADIGLLRTLASLVDRHHPNAAKMRPQDLVSEIEGTLYAELDLQRGRQCQHDAPAVAQLDDMYVPEVHWPLSANHAHHGACLRHRLGRRGGAGCGQDRSPGAVVKGVRVFYQQVFRDNFFHADAHAGNIWVDATRKDNPRFIALDFGIVGQLPAADQYYLAGNFMAVFQRDYRRIAELHVEAGWMPANVRIDELEAAVRAVCEPYFSRPLSEISLAEVMVKLFHRAALRIDRAAATDPAAENPAQYRGRGPAIGSEARHLGGRATGAREYPARRYAPKPCWRNSQTPAGAGLARSDMPCLVRLSSAVGGAHSPKMRSPELAELARTRDGQRQTSTILGTAAAGRAVLYSPDAGGPRVLGMPRRSGCGRALAPSGGGVARR